MNHSSESYFGSPQFDRNINNINPCCSSSASLDEEDMEIKKCVPFSCFDSEQGESPLKSFDAARDTINENGTHHGKSIDVVVDMEEDSNHQDSTTGNKDKMSSNESSFQPFSSLSVPSFHANAFPRMSPSFFNHSFNNFYQKNFVLYPPTNNDHF